jgi:hypothetical protein
MSKIGPNFQRHRQKLILGHWPIHFAVGIGQMGLKGLTFGGKMGKGRQLDGLEAKEFPIDKSNLIIQSRMDWSEGRRAINEINLPK